MRLRSPLKPIGKHTAKWKRWRDKNYGLLALRCKGICEGCGSRAPLDVHHLIGRRDEPFSSHVVCLAGLCRPCHIAVTNHTDRRLERRLEGDAHARWMVEFGSLIIPKDAWEYDSATNRIVRKQS